MKKTRKTLLISSIVLLGWLPTATIAATSAYDANAAIVGSSQRNNNANRNNNNVNQNNKNNQQNNNKVKNNNQGNNTPANTNQNTGSGLTNVQELPAGSVVNLAGPSGFIYSLYSSSGQRASRGLAGDTSWVTDKSATDSSGSTYYRVSTDEWGKADTGVTLN